MKSKKILFLIYCGLSFFNINCFTQDIKDIKAQLKKEPGVVIDVRTVEEYREGHYRFAQNLDWSGGVFQNNIEKLDKNKIYYLYCGSGGRSEQAAQFMKKKGFKKVYNLGGYSDMPKD